MGTGEATGRFPLTKHRFPEEVHIELRAVSTERPDRGAELCRRGIHYEMSDHTAQNPTGYRHDDSRKEWSEHAAEAHRSAQGHGQERGHLGRERREVTRGNPEVLRADDAVDEAHREVEPLRILQHSGEAPGGGVHRHPCSLLEPVAHERDSALGKLGGEGVVERCGRGGVGHGNPFAAV